MSYASLSPLSFLQRSAFVWKDKTAVIDGEVELSYGEFADEVQRFARALVGSGVGPGDRVAVLMPNVREMLMAHYAVPLTGALLVAINTRLSPDEVGYILQHSGARMLCSDPRFAETASSAVSQAEGVEWVETRDKADAAGDGRTAPLPWARFLARAEGVEALAWEVEDELAPISINYTSGTTGRPKGVVYTHRGAYLNALGELLHSRHTPESVYLWTLPMFHCNGWCTTWGLTAIGGTHVCLPEVRGDAIWSAIREHDVTHLNAAPTVLTTMLNAPEAAPLERPVVITTAGAAPSPTLIEQCAATGFDLVHVYGLTETYGPYTVCEVQPHWRDLDEEQRARLIARQGVGMIQTDAARVVDEQMRDVPADGETVGEIVMRGNNVMAGYYEDPAATDEAFRGGWFHSGDLGVMHPDGYVELRDRSKDIIISGGENISTIEVEQAIMSHETVLEVAVVGVSDDKWGERPRAYVVLKTGRTAEADEIVEHVRGRIARYKAPRDVEFVPSLPKTSTGKIQKYVLRSWAAAETG